MLARQLMSSDRIDWCTPAEVLDLVRQIGPIALDPCGNAQSIVRAARSYHDSGLELPWTGRGLVYCNPPYGEVIPFWTAKAVAEASFGAEVVLLLPARTDTAWWHRLARSADAVCFWAGRLTFLGAPGPAPFPSAVVYLGPRVRRFRAVFAHVGWIP